MEGAGLAAYIVDGVDPHQSEYPPERWRTRRWVSGFGGSAGTVVVATSEAGLWTDSRYHLEAEKALAGSGIDLFKVGQMGTPTMDEWLVERLHPGSAVGLPEETASLSRVEELSAKLEGRGLSVRTVKDLVARIWTARPAPADSAPWILDTETAGESRENRLKRLGAWLERQRLDGIVIATLDDIAWLLNLRGNDVPCNPVNEAFFVMHHGTPRLFARFGQAPATVVTKLRQAGVSIEPYEAFEDAVGSLPASFRVAGDFSLLPCSVQTHLSASLCRKTQPTRLWKAAKNDTEIGGMAEAAIRDGVALTRFFYWLDETLSAGTTVTEADCRDALLRIKSTDPDYLQESFEAICAAGANGAIVHYRLDPENAGTLTPGSLFLLDQGSHYRFGTTDYTRTVAIGSPTALQLADATEVLRAHVALATACFPHGTAGEQLDSVARDVLWRSRRSYGHGTGHGVGFVLNVHEGPCRIAAKCSNVPLQPGMVLSNEPGVYRPGRYGIRFENLMVVVDAAAAEKESSQPADQAPDPLPFLAFRTIGIAPIDRKLVDASRLTAPEVAWINTYLEAVWDVLGPRLDGAEKTWLEQRCRPV